MKKEYINPEMEVVIIKMNQQLLAGSPDGDPKDENPDEYGAPPFIF